MNKELYRAYNMDIACDVSHWNGYKHSNFAIVSYANNLVEGNAPFDELVEKLMINEDYISILLPYMLIKFISDFHGIAIGEMDMTPYHCDIFYYTHKTSEIINVFTLNSRNGIINCSVLLDYRYEDETTDKT